jgi:hypothetical protein
MRREGRERPLGLPRDPRREEAFLQEGAPDDQLRMLDVIGVALGGLGLEQHRVRREAAVSRAAAAGGCQPPVSSCRASQPPRLMP